MARFRFRLQTVLNVQQLREDAARARLAARERESLREEKRLLSLVGIQAQGTEKARRHGTGRLRPERMKAHADYLSRVADQVHAQRDVLRAAAERQELSRRELVDTGRRRKMYEHLRDAAREEHALDERRRDVRDTDEIAHQRTIRTNRPRS